MPNVLESTTNSNHKKQNPLHNEKGTYLTISAIVVLVLFGFAALGIEVGRWYLVQAEMSKAIDGAAFAGAANASNPTITDKRAFVQQVAEANFPDGLLGTEVNPSFVVDIDENDKVTINGTANVLNSVSKVLAHNGQNYSKTAVGAAGSAKLRKAEIALILDKSGSMRGTPIKDLRDAAQLFIDNFEHLQTDNRFALISFATGVNVDYSLNHDFHGTMTQKITNLEAEGWTNAEDALGQANDLTWSDQSEVAPNEKTGQYVIFFSDGNPTAFRSTFKYKGTDYDVVASREVNQHNDAYDYSGHFYKTDEQLEFRLVGGKAIDFSPTGNGLNSTNPCGTRRTVKWKIFADENYGMPWYGPIDGKTNPEACNLADNALKNYVDAVSRKMAIDHAQELKDNGYKVFTIGLGGVDKNFLGQLSSGKDYQYYTADSAELGSLFHGIANKIKLVLTS